ncbi:Hypothetical protein R9X50_00671000 [Acrodontium crateriforme]|uniref:WD40 repeat-like protein n=1 Tax=Acrodontium crateriforme TaxID=150365 RepID=A0AAQ3MDG4_9PEZI|nr:Hypothetical protein R9X50_00671000 [Acrodontium crateriforme]
MNSFLLNRQLGSISPQALAKAQNERLLESIQAAPLVHFSNQHPTSVATEQRVAAEKYIAHKAGVNSITIDKFEGRYLLSGGADSSVAIWDLEAGEKSPPNGIFHSPLSQVTRTSTEASLGITHISFYPFDSLAFLTSGYDRTIKLFSSETLVASATFNIGSTVYCHDTSTAGSHLLVACASQHPTVRLVDLRSGDSTHTLAGHSGSVLTVAWHPKNEHILASGATDGCCRLWDVRRSVSSLGVLDMDDGIGVTGHDGKGTGARRRERGKAHTGAVNGISWTEDGQYLISTGHDERMRVWNMSTGANTLANFGPVIKNGHKGNLSPIIPPSHLSPPGKETVFFLNPREILGFDMHSGTLQKRLRAPGNNAPDGPLGSIRNLKSRISALSWRAHHVEMYSAHADGSIHSWQPRTWEDVAADEEEEEMTESSDAETANRKRKRDELDQIMRDLVRKPR